MGPPVSKSRRFYEATRAILDSHLPPHLKFTAIVLASFDQASGDSIFPSLALVAWLIGKAPRRVRADVAALVKLRLLRELGPAGERDTRRGPAPKRYALDLAALPKKHGRQRPSFQPSSMLPNPDADVRVFPEKPGRVSAETRTPLTENSDAGVLQGSEESTYGRDQEPQPPADLLTLSELRKNLAAATHAMLDHGREADYRDRRTDAWLVGTIVGELKPIARQLGGEWDTQEELNVIVEGVLRTRDDRATRKVARR